MRVVRPFLVVLVVATSTTVVAACAQTDPATPAADRPATSTSSLVADRADVHFAQQMIIHHQGALDMAALAPQRAGSAQVAALARRIAAAQQPEIDLMSGWLEAWGAAVPDEDATMPGMHHGGRGGDGGMASDDDLGDLEAARGAAFDRLFLELMIVHHEGAVHMARMEERAGRDPGALALAERIVRDQTAEIAEMRALLAPLTDD